MSKAKSLFEHLAHKPARWLSGDGPEAGIVLSSRVRLARNIAGLTYPTVADSDTRRQVVDALRQAVEKSVLLKSGELITSGEITELDRNFLIERHLISPEFMKEKDHHALYVGEDEALAIMVNEEDHLRIQAITSGLEIARTYELADQADVELAGTLAFDFDRDFGFLTACPTNVGTGMRASVLIHLPGLVLTRGIDAVINRITKVGLAVRGFYGEGSDVLGNLFQISNQTTLGRSEQDILDSLEKVTRQIIEYELSARETLVRDAKEQIEDKIWRAYGILKYARVLSSAEVMNLLSAVRLGLGLGFIRDVSLGTINEILLLSQPSHLQKYHQKELSSNERDILRAELVRSKLA